MILIDSDQTGLNFRDGRFENELENMPLLIPEERLNRICLTIEDAIEEANERREVRADDGRTRLLHKISVLLKLGWIVTFHHRSDVLISKVNDGEDDGLRLLRDLRSNACLTKEQSPTARGDHFIRKAPDGITEQLGFIGIAGKD